MTSNRNGYSKRYSSANGDIASSNGHSSSKLGPRPSAAGLRPAIPTNRLIGVHGQRRLLLAAVVALTFFALFYTNIRYYHNRPNDYRLFYSAFPGVGEDANLGS